MPAALSLPRKGHSIALVLQGSPTEVISKQGNNLVASFQVRFPCSSQMLSTLASLYTLTKSSPDA